MNKKIRSKVKVTVEKTKALVKKVNVKVIKTTKSLQKKWKTEKPRRENFKKGLKTGANKMFSDGLKIGRDVAKVIRKDIQEINNK